MIPETNNYFFDTIHQLRKLEEVILYQEITTISPAEEARVQEFLEREYYQECLEYPFTAPTYDAAAALWAARTFCFAAQLIIYRKTSGKDLLALLPSYEGTITAEAMLSADLCLRFLPEILIKAKEIDPEDMIIPILEGHLKQWHYSAIGFPLETEMLDLEVVLGNKCLKQLYVDRIIRNKSKSLAKIPTLTEQVIASMGDYASYFWRDL